MLPVPIQRNSGVRPEQVCRRHRSGHTPRGGQHTKRGNKGRYRETRDDEPDNRAAGDADQYADRERDKAG